MEKNFAYVKKYKSVLNLIICTILSFLMGLLLLIVFQLDVGSEELDFWFYFDFIFSLIMVIISLSMSISVFVQQVKFNRSTPEYYISLLDSDSFKIDGKVVDIKDIKKVSYRKIHKLELFGDIKEESLGSISMTGFEYEKKIAEKAGQKAKLNYAKSIKKSNLGNIIIELESSTLVLKRVNDVENAVKELKKIIQEKGNM